MRLSFDPKLLPYEFALCWEGVPHKRAGLEFNSCVQGKSEALCWAFFIVCSVRSWAASSRQHCLEPLYSKTGLAPYTWARGEWERFEFSDGKTFCWKISHFIVTHFKVPYHRIQKVLRIKGFSVTFLPGLCWASYLQRTFVDPSFDFKFTLPQNRSLTS